MRWHRHPRNDVRRFPRISPPAPKPKFWASESLTPSELGTGSFRYIHCEEWPKPYKNLFHSGNSNFWFINSDKVTGATGGKFLRSDLSKAVFRRHPSKIDEQFAQGFPSDEHRGYSLK